MNTRLPAFFTAAALAVFLAVAVSGDPASSPCNGYGVCVTVASR